MALQQAMASSGSTIRSTPMDEYARWNRQLNFTIDVCALPHNAKHARYFSPKQNGLAQSWEGETVWLNPPYGDEIKDWMCKARDSAMYDRAIVGCLIPVRTKSAWWRKFVMADDRVPGRLLRYSYSDETEVHWYRREGLITGVYFHDKRIAFEGVGIRSGDDAPFDNAFVVLASPNRAPPRPLEVEMDDVRLTEGWPR